MDNLASAMANSATVPWQTNELRSLESAINTITVQSDLINRRWAQKWFENFQFVLGNQNLKWSKKYDFAFDTDFLSQDTSMNRNKTTTNVSRVVCETLSSHLFSNLPELDITSKYEESSRTERLSLLLRAMKDAYDERLNMHEELDSASVGLVMFSKIYAKISFDKNQGGKFKRAKQQIVQAPKLTTTQEMDPLTGQMMVVPVPVLDENDQPVMVEKFEDVLDETGNPVLETVKTGDVAVECVTPFEMRIDSGAKTFSRSKWIQQIRIMDYDDFMVEYADQPGMLDDRMQKIKGGTINQPVMSLAIRHFMRTMYSAPPSLDYAGRSTTAPMMMLKNKVLVVEHYDRPSEGHKFNPTPWLAEGRRVVMANGFIVGISTPQYRTNKQDGWHPFVEIKWMPMPPSMESSGPMSDIVQKNRQINLTDTLMQMAIERQSNSTLLINENSGIDKDKWTGDPGQTFMVSGDPSGMASYVADKNPLPALVNQYRQMQKDDIYEISGAGDAMRGERQPGTTSGYQAKIYDEREKRRVSKAKRNWEKGVASIYEKLFCCVQQNMVKLDDSVISAIKRSSNSDVTDSDVIAFLNGPMDYGVDIGIRASSMETKSKASQQALIQEAVGNPAIAQKMATDPAMLDNYMEFMEMDALRSVSSIHRERSKKENCFFNDLSKVKDPQRVQQMIADMPVVLWQDDDMVHNTEHSVDLVKNFDRYKNNQAVMTLICAHLAHHEQQQKAKNEGQDPFVARFSEQMAGRAQQRAGQRSSQEVQQVQQNFIERQQAMMAAEMAGQQQSNVAPQDRAGSAGGEQ
jgi:hypothetical protein